MRLEDLFVSHKLVDPVLFTPEKPELPRTIYLNLERALKATLPELLLLQPVEEGSPYKVGETYDTGYYDWRVRNYTPIRNELIKDYRNTTGDSRNNSKTLKSYRNSSDYQAFKKELDIFINNNPLYKNIKDSLDYLAALESRYKMNVENLAGSTALGWFLFMDKTRKPYNTLTRQEFANDALAQLLAAARYYTDLQNSVKNWGGDPNDFVTMYGAWWRPDSARIYIQDPTHNYKTKYDEDFHKIRQRAQDLFT